MRGALIEGIVGRLGTGLTRRNYGIFLGGGVCSKKRLRKKIFAPNFRKNFMDPTIFSLPFLLLGGIY